MRWLADNFQRWWAWAHRGRPGFGWSDRRRFGSDGRSRWGRSWCGKFPACGYSQWHYGLGLLAISSPGRPLLIAPTMLPQSDPTKNAIHGIIDSTLSSRSLLQYVKTVFYFVSYSLTPPYWTHPSTLLPYPQFLPILSKISKSLLNWTRHFLSQSGMQIRFSFKSAPQIHLPSLTTVILVATLPQVLLSFLFLIVDSLFLYMLPTYWWNGYAYRPKNFSCGRSYEQRTIIVSLANSI